jgi:hypothetical protein
MMLLGHDHTIFLVPDPSALDAVAERFADAGFNVTDRDDLGKDKAATAQKLICFADGSYVEILTIRDPAARAKHRFAHLLRLGEGWVDYAIYSDALDEDRVRLSAAGLPISGPHEHAKKLSNGRPWGVRLILAGIGAGFPALPLILEDTVGRELRIPQAHAAHPNLVSGTAGVTVAVHSLAEAEPQFHALFGAGSMLDRLPDGAARGLRFPVGSRWVAVVEPARYDSPLAHHIAARGEGVVSVTFARPGVGAGQVLESGLGPAAQMYVAEA